MKKNHTKFSGRIGRVAKGVQKSPLYQHFRLSGRIVARVEGRKK